MATDTSVTPAPTAPVDTTTQYLSNPTRTDANGNAYNTTYLNPNYKASTEPTSSVGIVTSNQSQNNYNSNVSTMNTANNGIKNSLGTKNADGTTTLPSGQILDANGSLISGGNNGGNNGKTPAQIAQETGQNIPQYDANGNYIPSTGTGSGSGAGTGGSGSGTGDSSTGSSYTVSDNRGNIYTIPAGVDPGLVSGMIANINAATGDISTYQQQMASLANYDVNTDPVAVAAAKSITDSFNVLIKQMQDKNTMLMGSISTNSARSGMLQYGNEMDSMYKNAEFDKGVQRIADLQQKELDAVNKSNQAYKDGNVKALAAATTDYNNAQKEGRQALLDLQTSINNQIKDNQAQAKIDAADAKTQNTQDITNSKAIAQATLDSIKSSGITDPTQLDAAIKEIADANGISNPEILKGQIATLDPQYGTAALKNANTQSTITARTKASALAATKAATAAAKAVGAPDTKAKKTFDADLKKQITSLNTSIPTQKQSWGDAYNTMAQNYSTATYMLDGVRVGLTQQLTPAQITSAGGNPKVDQTILDIKLNKTANQNKGS